MKVTCNVYFPLFRKFFERTISMPLPPVTGMEITSGGLSFKVEGVKYKEEDYESDEVISVTSVKLLTKTNFEKDFPEGLNGWTEYNY